MKWHSEWDGLSKLSLVSILATLSILSPALLRAEVYYALDEALELAFPNADEVNKKSYILSDSQLGAAQDKAKTKVDSKLFTFYHGVKNSQITAYAAIETQIVRTHPETLLVTLTPDGKVEKVVVLAFHEPPEYLPSDKWLKQFKGRDLSEDLFPGRDIEGIFGSTLSARSSSSAARKVLAMYEILLEEKE